MITVDRIASNGGNVLLRRPASSRRCHAPLRSIARVPEDEAKRDEDEQRGEGQPALSREQAGEAKGHVGRAAHEATQRRAKAKCCSREQPLGRGPQSWRSGRVGIGYAGSGQYRKRRPMKQAER